MADHSEVAGHIVEDLGHVLADGAQDAAAGRAVIGGIMEHLIARQMLRQGAAASVGSGGTSSSGIGASVSAG